MPIKERRRHTGFEYLGRETQKTGTRQGKDGVKRRMQERGTLLGSTTKEGTSKPTNKKSKSRNWVSCFCQWHTLFSGFISFHSFHSAFLLFYKVKVKSLSPVQLFATPWTVAHQPPPSMGFSRQEYWSGLPFPSSGDLPEPGIEPRSPTLQADALPSEPPGWYRNNQVLILGASQVALVVKTLPAIQKWIGSLGWEDPLEQEMVTHLSITA